MKKYSRVSYEDRCQISAMLKREFSIREIASELGFHKSTVYRELRRNKAFVYGSYYEVYNPRFANKKARIRGQTRGRRLKIVNQLHDIVTSKLKKKWSPEMISGRYKLETGGSLSHQTVYNFINANSQYRQYLKYPSRVGAGRLRQRRSIAENLNSIHHRPLSAWNRTRFGHWERDGMFGANRRQLLVCLERKSRYIRLGKMDKTDATYVGFLTEQLLKDHKVLSITNDNGTEFRKPDKCKHDIYYCDPMKPHQRGSVENVIGSLRKYIKRTTDLSLMDECEIKEIEDVMNNSPRKMFDYKTPLEVYYGARVALIN